MARLRRFLENAVKLYTYFRSSAAYRVRIALNLKGLEYEPQVANAVRFGDPEPYPRLTAINDACVALSAFGRAAPANQPDAATVQG